MKKIILSLAMIGSMAFAGSAYAQEDSLFEDKKDTVSIDDMDPVFYEAEEETAPESSSTTTIAIIAGVAVVAVGAFVVLKKKKK